MYKINENSQPKDTKEDKLVDKSNVKTISHILMRDPDTGETIMQKIDDQPKRETNESR